jgi:hypothetical protein
VTGHLFFRMLGLSVTYLKIDKRNTHLFYSSCSSSASPSDAEKRVVDHAVAHFVSAVHRLFSSTPLFVRDDINFYIARWARKKTKIAKITTAHSKSRLKVSSVHPGIFSALATISSKRVKPAVRL